MTVGMRCEVTVKSRGKQRGTVKYVGFTEFKADIMWIGIVLDEPFGKNNGVVEGHRYFECEAKYGIFARPDSVTVGDFPVIDELDFSDDEEI